MNETERITRRPMGRRGFMKAAGGLAVFGGVFTIVGCGDDDSTAATATGAAPVGTLTPTPSTAASATTAATTASASATGSATAALYTRLGGGSAIQAVVTDFLTNVGADTRINHFFANVDLTRLNTLLVQQIGMVTGGPEKYTGRDMKTTHAGLNITMTDFNSLVEDLVKSLDKYNVATADKNELLGILGPLSKDIVTA